MGVQIDLLYIACASLMAFYTLKGKHNRSLAGLSLLFFLVPAFAMYGYEDAKEIPYGNILISLYAILIAYTLASIWFIFDIWYKMNSNDNN